MRNLGVDLPMALSGSRSGIEAEAGHDLALHWRQDFEPHLVAMLDAKHARHGKSGYKPREAQDALSGWTG
jgi:hypothetical protein